MPHRFEEPAEPPYGHIRWNETDVSLDFHCTCGEHYRYRGKYAYFLHCPCGRVWQMPWYVIPVEVTGRDNPFVGLRPVEREGDGLRSGSG